MFTFKVPQLLDLLPNTGAHTHECVFSVCVEGGLGDKQEVARTSASALCEFGPTDFDRRYQLGEILNRGRYLIIPLYLPFQKTRQTPGSGLVVGVCTLEGMACLKGIVR